MQLLTIDLSEGLSGAGGNVFTADVQLSLKPFINFIKKRIEEEKTAKINFYKYLLTEFEAHPELIEPLKKDDTHKYKHLFELMYTALSPLLNDEEGQFWAIGKPVYPCFYYGTDAFYNILLDRDQKMKTLEELSSREEMEKKWLGTFYNLIMEKFYNISMDNSAQYLVKSIVDEETHLLKYYRMNFDARFMDVTYKGEVLPEMSFENVKDHLEEDALDILRKLIPPDMFAIEGVSIVSFTDVTSEYALESIKSAIIEHNHCSEGWSNSKISVALKSLVGTDAISFGLLPYIKLNAKTMIYSHEGFESIVIQQAKANGLPDKAFTTLVDDFVANPRTLVFPDVRTEDAAAYPMLQLVMDKGVKSYALFPLFYNGRLVGALELYSQDETSFNGKTMSKIDEAFPLLAQLFQNIITDFNNEIMGVVTDKFTALQPSVAWRFYQSAYNYLKADGKHKNLPVEPVYFEDVYPFYGAIDIRNSSIERNLTIRKDLYAHFDVLQTLLHNMGKLIHVDIENDFPTHHMECKVNGFADLSDREIMRTDDYLQRQLPPYLKLLADAKPEVSAMIDEYFELTKPGGKIFESRDSYELSMQMINYAVNRQLDEFNAELQALYPCYFEKFRTDGVEFDIYLGQSITPELEFSQDIVHDFRLRQLKAIAGIGRTTANLTSHLPMPLETTQLIFVYEKMIDISFRIDEQRFDVEGSYNIRYQMVKKRIDKAHIKDSTERLTQPGKIAIVYFNRSEAQEYLIYIKELQSQGLLTDVVEFLEIEELQGVEGLKALRVEVAMAYD